MYVQANPEKSGEIIKTWNIKKKKIDNHDERNFQDRSITFILV